MKNSIPVLVLCLLLVQLTVSKPTIYMKNTNDKLEPVLVPVSSTVIPIPVYHVSAGLGVKNSKWKKQKLKLTKPDGPVKLITVSGLKKMAANEEIKPH